MATKVLITSPKGKEKLVKAFKDNGAEVVSALTSDVKLIVPTVDEELPFFSKNKEFFEKQGIRVHISSEYAIGICRDKAEFYRFCCRHSFLAPTTGQFEAIIKPRFGKGSKGIIHVDRSYICQQIMTCPEYSIDYVGDWNGQFVSAVPRLRLNIVNGESQDGKIVLDEPLLATAKRLGEELGLVGHNTMQCFYDGINVYLGEVNCRFGGGFWISQSQFNSVKYLLDSL